MVERGRSSQRCAENLSVVWSWGCVPTAPPGRRPAPEAEHPWLASTLHPYFCLPSSPSAPLFLFNCLVFTLLFSPWQLPACRFCWPIYSRSASTPRPILELLLETSFHLSIHIPMHTCGWAIPTPWGVLHQAMNHLVLRAMLFLAAPQPRRGSLFISSVSSIPTSSQCCIHCSDSFTAATHSHPTVIYRGAALLCCPFS